MGDDDSDQIRRLLHAYGDAVLTKDDAAWAMLWVADCEWDLGPDRVIAGREPVVEHWRRSMAKYAHVVQLYLSSTATVSGDDATGRAYLVELVVPVVGDRRVFVGWYDDSYRRTPDGWRFSRRVLRRLYAGAPDLAGQFFGPGFD